MSSSGAGRAAALRQAWASSSSDGKHDAPATVFDLTAAQRAKQDSLPASDGSEEMAALDLSGSKKGKQRAATPQEDDGDWPYATGEHSDDAGSEWEADPEQSPDLAASLHAASDSVAGPSSEPATANPAAEAAPQKPSIPLSRQASLEALIQDTIKTAQTRRVKKQGPEIMKKFDTGLKALNAKPDKPLIPADTARKAYADSVEGKRHKLPESVAAALSQRRTNLARKLTKNPEATEWDYVRRKKEELATKLTGRSKASAWDYELIMRVRRKEKKKKQESASNVT